MATLHHPETDPEGFQMVNRAFKLAISYASKNHTVNTEDLAPLHECKPTPAEAVIRNGKMDENIVPDDFPAYLLNQSKGKTASEKVVEDSSQQEKICLNFFNISNAPSKNVDSPEDDLIQYDFNLHLEQGIDKNEQQIVQMLNKAHGIYDNPLCRNRKRSWKELFRSDAFRSLQSDALFTEKFLKCAMTFKKIQPWVWNDTFVPVMEEWSLYWSWSEFYSAFQVLKTYRFNKVKLVKKRFLRNILQPKFLFKIALFFILLCQVISELNSLISGKH